MSETRLWWSEAHTPKELVVTLEALGEEYPISKGDHADGIELRFERTDETGALEVSREENQALIIYDSPARAARGVGTVLAGLDEKTKTGFKTLGIMLDCSRNAVMTVDYLKKWLRRLALMGYDMAMLYTEDTYKLPDEPYFGYLRGAYTMEEIKEIDAYAAKLGVEIIACVQTLGHLEQILRWGAYGNVKDTGRVLLVDENATYDLIDKMLSFWKEALSTSRIHIGMDETHDLGRGKFMDKHGYERGFDIFNRHLDKVGKLCERHGLKPMIWSDMYFRMGCESGGYYDETTVIPDDVKAKIPKDVELVYWDYYHEDKPFYEDWIKRHFDLGGRPLMGSGVWTWGRLWYDHQKTMNTVKPCVEACQEGGVDELFFTMWGDDGGYCEYDSSLAGLQTAADMAYGEDGGERTARRFAAICDDDYQAVVLASGMQLSVDENPISAPAILWDDPLLGVHWKDMALENADYWQDVLKRYQGILEQINETSSGELSATLKHATAIFNALIKKIDLRLNLLDAYENDDRKRLGEIKDIDAPAVAEALKALLASMRKQWMRRNKPFGFETIQNRINGNIGRYEELTTRIGELLDGAIDNIPELDEKLDTTVHAGGCGHKFLVSGSVIA